MESDLITLGTSLKLAFFTTMILTLLGTPIAWWLARSQSLFAGLCIPLLALPLVLPPTVIGFYLLLAFSPNHLFGATWLDWFGSSLAFSFEGLLFGSIIYSLPFFMQPMIIAFRELPEDLFKAAASLGANAIDRFTTLVLPLSKHGFLIACTLTFAHTLGEFGIVLMIGGNLEGETRVLSIALFDYVETLNYERAHLLAAGLVGFSLITLTLVQWATHRGYRASSLSTR
ncbi:MAG: molybdate ABC transporter permease subunit [Pseudomonadales bacterium]